MGLALLGSANRDDSVFFEPNKINLGRRNALAVSFGSGPHFCIGAELGRATGAVAFESLLSHYPNLRLADQEIKWMPTVTQHGLVALHVSLS
jgi:cytochrome P450